MKDSTFLDFPPEGTPWSFELDEAHIELAQRLIAIYPTLRERRYETLLCKTCSSKKNTIDCTQRLAYMHAGVLNTCACTYVHTHTIHATIALLHMRSPIACTNTRVRKRTEMSADAHAHRHAYYEYPHTFTFHTYKLALLSVLTSVTPCAAR